MFSVGRLWRMMQWRRLFRLPHALNDLDDERTVGVGARHRLRCLAPAAFEQQRDGRHASASGAGALAAGAGCAGRADPSGGLPTVRRTRGLLCGLSLPGRPARCRWCNRRRVPNLKV